LRKNVNSLAFGKALSPADMLGIRKDPTLSIQLAIYAPLQLIALNVERVD